jgi:hypothetical protein
MATFLKTALVLAICLILADLIGVILCILFGILPLRGNSALLPYAVWFIVGGFSGFIAITGAGGWIAGDDEQGEWSARPDAPRLAGAIALSSAVVLAAISTLFYFLIWRGAGRVGFFVPDSMPHTLTFFGATIAAMLVAWAALRPERRGDAAR